MTAVFFDRDLPDDARRTALYGGDLFVYSARPAAMRLVEHARAMIEEAFKGLDPERAQYELPVEDFAAVLAQLKPAFIHHPVSKQCVGDLLIELGCDPDKTHFDVPRMRSSTAHNYLTTGIAYAFHPHRDTWYSAPPCQLNWWLPIYPIEANNGLAFHPHYFSNAVKNNSHDYDYYDWNANNRADAAKHIKTDTRVQPKPQEAMELDPQIRIVSPPGGVTIFSAAQMHSSVPNTSDVTRYSIDFRTVHIDDAAQRHGARMIDSHCTGTALRDFLRIRDHERVPEAIAAQYDDGARADGLKIYAPNTDR